MPVSFAEIASFIQWFLSAKRSYIRNKSAAKSPASSPRKIQESNCHFDRRQRSYLERLLPSLPRVSRNWWDSSLSNDSHQQERWRWCHWFLFWYSCPRHPPSCRWTVEDGCGSSRFLRRQCCEYGQVEQTCLRKHWQYRAVLNYLYIVLYIRILNYWQIS